MLTKMLPCCDVRLSSSDPVCRFSGGQSPVFPADSHFRHGAWVPPAPGGFIYHSRTHLPPGDPPQGE